MSRKEEILAKLESDAQILTQLNQKLAPLEREIRKKMLDLQTLQKDIETHQSVFRETISKTLSTEKCKIPCEEKQKINIEHTLREQKINIVCLIDKIIEFNYEKGIYRYVIVNPNTPWGPIPMMLEIRSDEFLMFYPIDNSEKIKIDKISF